MSEEPRSVLSIAAIVGLGNPGPRYSSTRHNIGFMVADRAAADLCAPGDRWSAAFGSDLLQVRLQSERILVIKPQQFMNRSGQPVVEALHYYKVPAERMLVIHDDIDLPLGKLRIRKGGGAGGHNGIRSIMNSLGTDDFIRLRIGVGRPEAEGPPIEVSDWVLSRFFESEREELENALVRAVAAIKVIATEGVTAGQNSFN